MKGYFIAGTDTHVGKTLVAGKLISVLVKQGHKTAGLKPVATGCIASRQGLRNLDALHLQENSSIHLPYPWINPFAFEAEITPSVAAARIGETLSVSKILNACQPILSSDLDWLVVEGVGGWRVPLNDQETMAELAIALGFPIILVVKIQLGCINHSLLTYDSLLRSQAVVQGWVANVCTPSIENQEGRSGLKKIEENTNQNMDDYVLESIETIRQYVNVPFLGIIPYNGIHNSTCFDSII